MKKTSILFFIALIISVAGCRKNSVDKYYKIPIQQELKNYFATAKSGSYFVYQDTVSGVIDTFKLSSYSEGQWGMGCNFKINGKEATYSITQYNYTTTYKNKTFLFQLISDCDNLQHSFIEMRFGAAMPVMKINIDNNKFVLTSKADTNGDSITPNFNATYRNWGGEIFQDVYYFDSQAEDFGGGNYDYVVAKNIGIIGYKSRVGEYWRLIDKKIVL